MVKCCLFVKYLNPDWCTATSKPRYFDRSVVEIVYTDYFRLGLGFLYSFLVSDWKVCKVWSRDLQNLVKSMWKTSKLCGGDTFSGGYPCTGQTLHSGSNSIQNQCILVHVNAKPHGRGVALGNLTLFMLPWVEKF